MSALGTSYLAIYAFGMMMGMGYDKIVKLIVKRKVIIFIGWLLAATMAYFTFWHVIDNNNKVLGLDNYIEYTINPPNLSVTFYAVMTTALAICIYSKHKVSTFLEKTMRVICILGKYSLDIYLWHILLQNLCVRLYSATGINIWLLRIISYTAMFGMPITGRRCWIILKEKGTSILKNINPE